MTDRLIQLGIKNGDVIRFSSQRTYEKIVLSDDPQYRKKACVFVRVVNQAGDEEALSIGRDEPMKDVMDSYCSFGGRRREWTAFMFEDGPIYDWHTPYLLSMADFETVKCYDVEAVEDE
ncbi:hypothetical protein MMC09_006132 [Bachmanniomyces sp. S44760]|nr:hypothetical protein [Bachmanniomyces sp. S44760]